MRLIFVYNANAGLVAGVLDSIHKTLSPATYPCSLCAITYGPFSMDGRWRRYLQRLGIPATFHHRPDFRNAFPAQSGLALPVIGTEDGGVFEVLINAAELDGVESLDALMSLLDQRLRTKTAH